MMTTAVAYHVHRGKVFGCCENTTGVAAFTDLVSHVMTAEPYALADRVFWIVDNGAPTVDNGSSHRGQAATDSNGKCSRPMTHRYRRRLRPPVGAREPLPPDRKLVPVETHHHRPHRTSDQARQPQTRAQPRPRPTPRRVTPDELTRDHLRPSQFSLAGRVS